MPMTWIILVLSLATLCCCGCLPLLHNPNATTTTASSTAAAAAADRTCFYRIQVDTGTEPGAGTDARVSLRLSSASGKTVLDIKDLESWDPDHNGEDLFERGGMDKFYGHGPCMDPCSMLLRSDGTGPYPGWYVTFVGVYVQREDDPFGHHPLADRWFRVLQWLAVDEPPFQLSAYREDCGNNLASSSV